VCDLIESKNPPGVMLVLDDVCKSVHAMAEGADKAFMQRVTTAGGGNHPHFQLRGVRFNIKHYAGDVQYDIEGMVEKNKDSLYKDLLDVTGISSNQMLLTLFPEARDGSSEAKPTTGTKIRTQANLLYKTLAACCPHYVRCVRLDSFFLLLRSQPVSLSLSLSLSLSVRRSSRMRTRRATSSTRRASNTRCSTSACSTTSKCAAPASRTARRTRSS